MSFLAIVLTIAFLLLLALKYFDYVFSNWKKKGIPFVPPNFFVGNSNVLFNSGESYGTIFKNLYLNFKQKNAKHFGLYFLTIPVYVPIDLEYIKRILINDFQNFPDRGLYHNSKSDPLTENLFLLEGHKWKQLRTKMFPTFSPSKLKNLIHIFATCSDSLNSAIDKNCRDNQPINVNELMACFTTDVISLCAFGIESNSCKNPRNIFRKYGRMGFRFTRFQWFKHAVACTFPNFCRFIGLSVLNKKASKFFTDVFRSTVNNRLKNNVHCQDFMQLLIHLYNDDQAITFNEMVAQAFVFFLAGFETSSSTITFALLELSLNTTIQEKAAEEVISLTRNCNNTISYESLSQMHYLQQILDETLRKYPALPTINRKCSKDYTLPDSNITINKGTPVVISILGIHHDPDLYLNPDVFDPERFSENNKRNRHALAYLPFGAGPRTCIGMRFGLLQSKYGLAVLLQNYSFSLNHKTKLPLKLNPGSLVMDTLDAIYLNAKHRN